MKFRDPTRLLFMVAVIAVCATMLHASELPPRAVHSHRPVVRAAEDGVSGAFPFNGILVSEMPGPDLETSTIFSATDTRTSGFGRGDFARVRVDTSFGPFTLNDTQISNGGGFSIGNTSDGTFTATGGFITTETPSSLVFELNGTFEPGSFLRDETESPATAILAFTKNDGSISVSGTLNAVPIPEPETLVTMGTGLCGIVTILAVEFWFDYRRHKLLHR